MMAVATADRRRWVWPAWMVAAVALLAIGGVSLWAGLRGQYHPLAGPVHRSHGSTLTVEQAVAPAQTPSVAQSVPIKLNIPAIGLSEPLSELDLNPDGTVQVPTDFQEPGWYDRGPSPGQLGSAVILGHVDSYRGPAAFFNLRQVVPGDQVDVILQDGLVVHFTVSATAMYPKAKFPALEVYGPHGYSGLQLVTCGGAFDPQTGHYLSNVVVYSRLTSVTPVMEPER